MKALVIDREPGSPMAWPPRLSIAPGSAIVASPRPWFLPDLTHCRWLARPAIAFRLCKLGKGMELRFAGRYIDAAAPALLLDSEPLPGGSRQLLCSLDGALALGAWQPLADTYRLSAGGLDITLDAGELDVPGAIALLGSAMTLQQGDLLLPALLPAAIPLEPDTRAEASLNGIAALSMKVK